MVTVSVVSCIYNKVSVMSKTIESIISHTTLEDYEYILVYNNPPYEGVKEYITEISKKYPQIRILDDGINHGCTRGYTWGFKEAKGKFIVKQDDDTIVTDLNWGQKMMKAFEKIPKLAYISSDMDPPSARQWYPYKEVDYGDDVRIQEQTPMTGFGGSVMFSAEFMKEIDYFHAAAYNVSFSDGVKTLGTSDGLYGGEEVYVAKRARELGYTFGYFPSVRVIHQDNTEREDLYPFWKWYYGYVGEFQGDLKQFIDSPTHIYKCFNRILGFPNDWYKVKVVKLLLENNWNFKWDFVQAFEEIEKTTENGALKEAAHTYIEESKKWLIQFI